MEWREVDEMERMGLGDLKQVIHVTIYYTNGVTRKTMKGYV